MPITTRHIQAQRHWLPFKANYGQDPRMGFEMRKKEKYKGAQKFIEKIREIQKEAKTVLGKSQEEIKKYANRNRGEVKEYWEKI